MDPNVPGSQASLATGIHPFDSADLDLPPTVPIIVLLGLLAVVTTHAFSLLSNIGFVAA